MQEIKSDKIKQFCDIVRERSREHHEALGLLENHGNLTVMFSILRQELDSMIRVIYLLTMDNLEERMRLVDSTMSGEEWRRQTTNGNWKKITDRDMVELSQTLQGWTQSVYKFGCAFIHLSKFHDHKTSNPFSDLAAIERQDILEHMRYYHGGPVTDDPSFEELGCYIPRVFEKISSNLKCYLQYLEQNKSIEE